MDILETILKIANEKKTFKTADVVDDLKGAVTRAWVSAVISGLVKDGELVKYGSTAGATYALPKNAPELGNSISKHLLREGLKEHVVLDSINHQAPFLNELSENVRSLFDYAFSEMLNNAIEHSLSKFVDVRVGADQKTLWFEVSDTGIGVFRNVMEKRNLPHEFEAMQDLLKGKATTHPVAHSGEGIFFTSKVADTFVLNSFGYSLRVDNTLPDIFFEQTEKRKGTKVSFSIAKATEKHLTHIFSLYETDHEDPDFDKTEIQVKLYKIGTIYVSRSQARRIMSGLEKFKHIILNFDMVPTIGQAFADEIFRVFKQKYPAIKISSTHMNEAVKYMIDRVDKNNERE
jgi:anti-sigma regulatory factor (Ser/Thr protein kinase)